VHSQNAHAALLVLKFRAVIPRIPRAYSAIFRADGNSEFERSGCAGHPRNSRTLRVVASLQARHAGAAPCVCVLGAGSCLHVAGVMSIPASAPETQACVLHVGTHECAPPRPWAQCTQVQVHFGAQGRHHVVGYGRIWACMSMVA
jgi:hypothetical protein